MVTEIPDSETENLESTTDIPVLSDQSRNFQLETEGQISDGIEALNQIPEIHSDRWEQLHEEQERLSALQDVEDRMANIQGRPRVSIESVPMPENMFGGWDGESIKVNRDHLMGEQPVMENVDTIIHEGRHAYQDYAISHPEIISDPGVVETWSDNMQDYKDIQTYGPEIYQDQPVERDAWSYATAIQQGVYGHKGS
jgi:hypothetical protein